MASAAKRMPRGAMRCAVKQRNGRSLHDFFCNIRFIRSAANRLDALSSATPGADEILFNLQKILSGKI